MSYDRLLSSLFPMNLEREGMLDLDSVSMCVVAVMGAHKKSFPQELLVGCGE